MRGDEGEVPEGGGGNEEGRVPPGLVLGEGERGKEVGVCGSEVGSMTRLRAL